MTLSDFCRSQKVEHNNNELVVKQWIKKNDVVVADVEMQWSYQYWTHARHSLLALSYLQQLVSWLQKQRQLLTKSSLKVCMHILYTCIIVHFIVDNIPVSSYVGIINLVSHFRHFSLIFFASYLIRLTIIIVSFLGGLNIISKKYIMLYLCIYMYTSTSACSHLMQWPIMSVLESWQFSMFNYNKESLAE